MVWARRDELRLVRIALLWAGICFIGGIAAAAQSPESASVACTKTISFAVAEGGQPVPAIPKFAAKWIGKKYHFEAHPELCLSQIPSSSTANYVVILSTSDASFAGLTPTAHTYTSAGPQFGNLAGVSSYGGTWNYAYSSNLPAGTTSTLDLQRIDASKKVLFLRAYDQRGRQVAHYSVDADHNRERLLESVMADIYRDSVERPSQMHLPAPLSVYYVNCDVDAPGAESLKASTAPQAPLAPPVDPKPVAPPPPPPTLDFWSNPAGADVYLDGSYAGKTPFTATVAPGEHVIVVRKQDYGSWQRKVQVVTGARKVSAYLERKFVNLGSGQ